MKKAILKSEFKLIHLFNINNWGLLHESQLLVACFGSKLYIPLTFNKVYSTVVLDFKNMGFDPTNYFKKYGVDRNIMLNDEPITHIVYMYKGRVYLFRNDKFEKHIVTEAVNILNMLHINLNHIRDENIKKISDVIFTKETLILGKFGTFILINYLKFQIFCRQLRKII